MFSRENNKTVIVKQILFHLVFLFVNHFRKEFKVIRVNFENNGRDYKIELIPDTVEEAGKLLEFQLNKVLTGVVVRTSIDSWKDRPIRTNVWIKRKVHRDYSIE